MKLLITSNDHSLIGELSYCLRGEGIEIHIGNQGTSSLAGSGSYQQAIYILNPDNYDKACRVLNDLDERHKLEISGEINKIGRGKRNNKWLVFVIALLVVLLFCTAVF